MVSYRLSLLNASHNVKGQVEDVQLHLKKLFFTIISDLQEFNLLIDTIVGMLTCQKMVLILLKIAQVFVLAHNVHN